MTNMSARTSLPFCSVGIPESAAPRLFVEVDHPERTSMPRCTVA